VKRARQHALMELVRTRPLASQHEIREHLSALGHEATQSTISRDLEELGLVRIRDGGGRLRYGRPDDAAALGAKVRLRTLLAEFLTSVASSGNLVVLKTTPGAANAVAETLDHAGVEGVLGTIAGDDTLLVIAAEGTKGKALAKRLAELGGQESRAETASRTAAAVSRGNRVGSRENGAGSRGNGTGARGSGVGSRGPEAEASAKVGGSA
jgi:transcriptional regulator of arginine metabolism